jgi:hypothetical protein
MEATLGSVFTFYVFTTGRRLFAMRQVKTAAQHLGFDKLVAHCDKAIEHDLATRALEQRWRSEPSPAGAVANPIARKIDILVDNTLAAIRDTAAAQKRGAAADDPIHANVETFLKRVFTIDLQVLIKLPFVEESAAVDDIVTLLNGELASYVEDLGLTRLAKRLTDLAVQYREALDAAPPSLMTWGKVRAARAEGQELLYEAVCIILGKYHARTPETVAARESLLAPIRKQNDAIGEYLRSRRAIDDVNPETGEEEPDTAEGSDKHKAGDGKKTEPAKADDGKKTDGAKTGGTAAEEAAKGAAKADADS